jgi:glutamate synthase (NADPH/NADH) small chain
MGKTTGFLEWQRVPIPKRDKRERIGDWQEIYLPRAPEESRHQAGRCMDCGVPFCQAKCPLGNLIPDWNHLVYTGDWKGAYRRLDATNNFPDFTGRLCPAPCEGGCVLAIPSPSNAVTIEHIELEIIERAFREGWVEPRRAAEASGRTVGVVGSGPAGLAAAQQLARAGHAVTVYEAADRPGGLLRYGIPDFKMEKWALDRRLAVMEEEGVTFRCGVALGGDLGWDELRARHDAILIAVGARRPRDLEVPGRELDGVCFAMDYLTQQNRVVAGEAVPDQISARGKRVVILGGGDTGSDCYGTALRQGAAHVLQVELFPAPPATRAADNPWPEWPVIFRTSSSQEEGGERDFAVMSKRLRGEGGRVRAIEAVRVELAVDGAARRLVERAGSGFEVPADLVVLAMGFLGPETDALRAQLGVELDARGNVKVDGSYATSVDGVFAAGDASRGQSLIVWAIADGRNAAAGVDRYLRAAASRAA